MILQPRFACDDAVRVIRNLRNDGTYPGEDTGVVLVRRGSIGYVCELGVFLQDQIIYTVHFLDSGGRMVGCRETELIAADAPWSPNRFERGDRVTTRLPLAVGGEVAVAAGTTGEVMAVIREPDAAAHYHVLFNIRVLDVPESALDAVQSLAMTD